MTEEANKSILEIKLGTHGTKLYEPSSNKAFM